MKNVRKIFSDLSATYGMLAVLLLLCVYFTWSTIRASAPTGTAAAILVADDIAKQAAVATEVVIVTSNEPDDADFAKQLQVSLTANGLRVLSSIQGDPPQIREKLEALSTKTSTVDWIVTTRSISESPIWESLRTKNRAFTDCHIVAPGAVRKSVFLTASNLRNIADQIAVIAVLAVGMTLVIITGGIDLSVGSLLALSSVSTAFFIQKWGGTNAGVGAMLAASILAILLCGMVGGFSGWLIARFRVPPFIVTLAGMQIASGLAFMIAGGQSLYEIPASFTGLGRGATIATIPNAVLLMLVIYILANLFMTRTLDGRGIYAIGGNREAARLSGINVSRTTILVYIVSALLAGVGGIVTTSQLRAGAPTYGGMYEMFAIAAVVVGGTSLSGGQGRIFGTLIGALVIAVIRNGMNLMDVEPYTQKVLLGVVILAAVLADMLRQHGSGVRAKTN